MYMELNMTIHVFGLEGQRKQSQLHQAISSKANGFKICKKGQLK